MTTRRRKCAAVRFLESIAVLCPSELRSRRSVMERSGARPRWRERSEYRAHLCDIEKGRKFVSPGRAAEFARTLGYSERHFVRLALQKLVDEAGLDLEVRVA